MDLRPSLRLNKAFYFTWTGTIPNQNCLLPLGQDISSCKGILLGFVLAFDQKHAQNVFSCKLESNIFMNKRTGKKC